MMMQDQGPKAFACPVLASTSILLFGNLYNI